MEYTVDFLKVFGVAVLLASPIILFLVAVIIGLGLLVGRREGWTRGNSIYWAMITATTVGYGDFTPKRPLHRILAIIICLTGLVATGIIVSSAVYAAGHALEKHVSQEEANELKEMIE